MFKVHRFLCSVAVLCLCTSCGQVVELSDDARQSSEDWLALVDAEKYDESWHQASSIFQSAVMKSDWIQQVRRVRKPIGALKARRQRTAIAKTDPASSPDGNYLLVTYDSVFERKQSTIETLTLFQEGDGRWRTAGYFVK